MGMSRRDLGSLRKVPVTAGQCLDWPCPPSIRPPRRMKPPDLPKKSSSCGGICAAGRAVRESPWDQSSVIGSIQAARSSHITHWMMGCCDLEHRLAEADRGSESFATLAWPAHRGCSARACLLRRPFLEAHAISVEYGELPPSPPPLPPPTQ